jgi:hypothetical protein
VVELDGEQRTPVQAQRNFVMTSACGKVSLQDLEANGAHFDHRQSNAGATARLIAAPELS